MKILGLCFLILVGIAPLSAQQTPKNDQSPARMAPFTAHPPLFGDSHEFLFRHYVASDRIYLEDFSEPTCAYLRTYRVKRPYRDSDVVNPAGYTTCVPTRRFEMKSAVQAQSEFAPRE